MRLAVLTQQQNNQSTDGLPFCKLLLASFARIYRKPLKLWVASKLTKRLQPFTRNGACDEFTYLLAAHCAVGAIVDRDWINGLSIALNHA